MQNKGLYLVFESPGPVSSVPSNICDVVTFEVGIIKKVAGYKTKGCTLGVPGLIRTAYARTVKPYIEGFKYCMDQCVVTTNPRCLGIINCSF